MCFGQIDDRDNVAHNTQETCLAHLCLEFGVTLLFHIQAMMQIRLSAAGCIIKTTHCSEDTHTHTQPVVSLLPELPWKRSVLPSG